MGLDTKICRLTDRQSQCEFNFDFDFDFVNSTVRSQLVQLGQCSEIGDRRRGPEAVSKEFVGSTVLEIVTRQRLVNIQHTEKT
jgi:hypothetical protein